MLALMLPGLTMAVQRDFIYHFSSLAALMTDVQKVDGDIAGPTVAPLVQNMHHCC